MHDIEALLAHEPFLRALARSLVRDPGEADDAVQETWTAALRNPPREGPTVRAWLAAVLRNAVRQGRRAAGRRGARERSAARPEAVPSDAEIREREVLRREVVDAVLALEHTDRDVLVLLYFEGLPPREAALRLGVPVETLKSRRKRALSRIREALDCKRGGREAWVAALLPFAGFGAPDPSLPMAPPRGVIIATAASLLVLAGVGVAMAVRSPPTVGGAAGNPGPLGDGRTASVPSTSKPGERMVRGSVRTPAGVPLEGVLVALMPGDGGRGTAPESTAGTGPDGEFALPTAPGAHSAKVVAHLDSVDGATLLAEQVVPTSSAGADPRVDLVLDPGEGGTILLVPRFAGEAPTEAQFIVKSGGSTRGLGFRPATTRVMRLHVEAGARGAFTAELRASGWFPRTAGAGLPEPGRTVRLEVEATVRGPTSGRVVDSAGRGVPEALVYIEEDPRFAELFGADRCGKGGTFPVTAEMAGRWLVAWAPGRGVSEWVLPPAGAEEVVLVLGPGGIVEGRVVDRDTGALVPGVPVDLEFGDSRSGSPGSRTTLSAMDGTYRFGEVPLGTVIEPVPQLGFRAGKPPHREREGRREEILPGRIEDGEATILRKHGERWERDVPVLRRPGVEAQVRLRFPEGTAIPLTVGMTEEWHEGGNGLTSGWTEPLAAEASIVRLFLPRGTVSVAAAVPGLGGGVAPMVIEGDGAPVELEIALRPRPRVLVQLTGEAGAPLLRADVHVLPALRPPWTKVARDMGTRSTRFFDSVLTDPSGRADLRDVLPSVEDGSFVGKEFLLLVEGEGVLTTGVDRPSLRLDGDELLRRLRDAGPDGIVLRVPAPSTRDLRVRVVDGEDRPVAGVRVIVPNGDGGPNGYETRLGPWTSGSDGIVVLPITDESYPNSYDAIRAVAPWHGEMRFESVLKRADAGEVADLRVLRLVPFQVTVKNGRGAPVTGARVYFDGREFAADGNGVITVQLPDSTGPLSVGVVCAGFLDGTVSRVPGATAGEVVLVEGRKISVEVAVPEGCGPDMVVASYDPASGRRWMSTSGTAMEGVFRLNVSVPATGARLVGWTGNGDRRGEVHAAGNEDRVRIPLEPVQPSVVALRFEDGEGRPLTGLEFVAVYYTGGPQHRRTGVTSSAGSSEISVPLEKAGRLLLFVPDRLVWGPPSVVEDRPGAPLSYVVEGVRKVPVDARRRSDEEWTWFALGAGKGPLWVWGGKSIEEDGRIRYEVSVPASATTLRLDRDGRISEFPIPAGDGVVVVPGE